MARWLVGWACSKRAHEHIRGIKGERRKTEDGRKGSAELETDLGFGSGGGERASERRNPNLLNLSSSTLPPPAPCPSLQLPPPELPPPPQTFPPPLTSVAAAAAVGRLLPQRGIDRAPPALSTPLRPSARPQAISGFEIV